MEWETFAALIGLVVVIVSCLDPRYLIALFALSFLTIVSPSLRLKIGGLWIPLPALIAALLCAREAVRRWSNASEKVPLNVPVFELLLLAAGLLASGMTMVRPNAYLADLIKWAAHVLIFITMCMALERARWVYALVDALGVVVAILAAYGLYRVASGLSYDIDVFEGVATRNAAAFYITSVLPILYARLLWWRGARRWGYLLLFGILVAAQVFTYTRAGWIASAAGLLFVSGRRMRAYVLIALAVLVVLVTAPQSVRNRFETLFVTVDYGVNSPLSSSTVVREHLLHTGIRMVQDNWLFGVGLGNYWDSYDRYAVPGSPPIANTPHDFYVLLWAEGGILSLVAFLWFYGSRMRLVWRARKQVGGEAAATLLGLLGSFVALAVEACFSNDLNILITWTLLGTGTALARAAQGGVE